MNIVLNALTLVSLSLAKPSSTDLFEIEIERVNKTLKTHHDDIYQKNIRYYTDDCLARKAYIGSDEQEFMFLLDTGSLYTWVQSIICISCPSSE
jgi:hypothetical protein